MAENKSSSTKKNAAASAKRETGKSDKMRLRPIWAVVLAVIIIALLAVCMKSCSGSGKQQEEEASIGIIDMNVNVQSIEETKAIEQTVVKIDLQSCKIVVGEKIYVTATVTPADTGKSLQWKSSDEKIFKVSNDGILEVLGVGTAALTATVGDVSDAIVIEGIANADDKSQMNLPGYNEVISGNPGGEGSTGNNAQTNTDSESQGAVQPATPQGATAAQGAAAQSSAAQGIATQSSGSQPFVPPVSTAASPPPTQAAIPPVTVTQAPESNGLRSSQLPEVLGSYGYRASGENVYVYGEGDAYTGEIIVQPNLVIIYIKRETEEYSRAVLQVLSELLPEEYNQAWNNYKSATTDRTFTLEGRTVRIVAAVNGGHSQIVVYN